MADNDEEKRSCLVRMEQESVGWKEYLFNKFLKRGELIIDPFPGTFAAANVRLDPQRQCPSVGCKDKADSFATSEKA